MRWDEMKWKKSKVVSLLFFKIEITSQRKYDKTKTYVNKKILKNLKSSKRIYMIYIRWNERRKRW
jgi:hypothetical protein